MRLSHEVRNRVKRYACLKTWSETRLNQNHQSNTKAQEYGGKDGTKISVEVRPIELPFQC